MATPRPYGTGPYGTGYYSRYRGVIYDAAGRTGLLFGAHATFAVTINPWATAGIVFAAWSAHAAYSWVVPPAHEPGTWTPAAPCEGGVWALPPGCIPGNWQTTRIPGAQHV